MRDALSQPKTADSWLLLSALLIGLSLRLWLAWRYAGNFDEQSFELVAGVMRRGENLYTHTQGRYNYSPLWAYFLLFFSRVADAAGLPFHFVLRGFLSFVDIANGALVGLIAAQLKEGWGRRAAALYWLHPVAILVVGLHGQFETLAMLPLLGAAWLVTRRPNSPLGPLWTLGALALTLKHILLFGVWTLFVTVRSRRALLLMGGALLVFALSFAPFLPSGAGAIWGNVLRYQGQGNSYGLGLLPRLLTAPLFFSVMLLLPFVARRENLNPVHAIELSFVAFLALTYGIGEQYFLMPILWGCIGATRRPAFWAFGALATFFLLTSSNNLQLLHLPARWDIVRWNGVWLAALWWLASEVRGFTETLKVRSNPRCHVEHPPSF